MGGSTKSPTSKDYSADEPTSKNGDKPATLTVSGMLGPSNWRTIKCYRCYGYDVDSICHHTGKFLCRKCSRKSSTRFFTDNVFAYLKPLKSQLKQAAHSPEFIHHDQFTSLIWILGISTVAFIILFGVWLSFNWLQIVVTPRYIGLYGIGVFIGIWVGKLILDRYLPNNVTYPFGLPLFAKINVELKERVEADFNITDGPYLVLSPVARGVIQVTMGVTPDDLARYESAPLPRGASNGNILKFHAGFVALETLKNVEFIRPVGHRKNNLLILTKEVDLESFKTRCREGKSFELAEPYWIQTDALKIGPPHDKEFPLSIKTRLENGNRRLRIMLEAPRELIIEYPQSNRAKNRKGKQGLKGRPILKSLTLHIPTDCEVENSSGHFDRQTRTVTWQNKAIDVSPVFSVVIEFQQALGKKTKFKGEYSIVINNWTISQMHIAQDVTAQGKPFIRLANGLRSSTNDDNSKEQERLIPTVRHSTTIEGKLCLNTDYLLSQQVQTVSNLFAEADERAEMSGKEKLMVMPNHEVINVLIEALTSEKVFIKQVTETHGPIKETDTGSHQTRYWEITGKYYLDTLHPADLHLVIVGEGPLRNRPNCEGVLIFELSLRSNIETGDPETPKRLKQEYKKFVDIIRIAVYKGRQVDYRGRRILGWQLEEHFEDDLKPVLNTNQVAVILNGHDPSRRGYIFSAPDTGPNLPPKLAGLWELRRYPELPSIQVPGYKWVDKWQLLKKLEEEAN